MSSTLLKSSRRVPLWALPAVAILALPAPAQTPAAAPAVAVSGTVFGNYMYLTGGPRRNANQFVVDRAYLTARGTVAPRTSFRVTTDVFQAADGSGWDVRLKYGYLNYLIGGGRDWVTDLRAGMLQTVVIEHQEQFWPRWLGNVAVDRHGFFSSADVGVSAGTALPGRLGETYLHVVNGPGFARRETDRFKDFGARLTLTPLATRGPELLRTFAITAWTYQGATASRFVADAVNPVGDALARDRSGVFAGIRDPRITLGAEYAARTDDGESGDNSVASPRVVATVDGRVASAFVVARPLAWGTGRASSPLAIIGRFDRVEPDDAADTDFHYTFAGLAYDLNARAAVSLNYQEQLGEAVAPTTAFRGWFANFVVSF